MKSIERQTTRRCCDQRRPYNLSCVIFHMLLKLLYRSGYYIVALIIYIEHVTLIRLHFKLWAGLSRIQYYQTCKRTESSFSHTCFSKLKAKISHLRKYDQKCLISYWMHTSMISCGEEFKSEAIGTKKLRNLYLPRLQINFIVY